ncbi:HsdR family type I site-specific deoxyribonuclease [Candidatus Poribacteria bacterium]|nr:HsdR family type I site-specific deoxyribonuclease [Candidatus Poribacteria bacterium]MYG06131.1 HsdR family type I site-specific deoxyribonuclease [Candidatus Poribacteria bacterium]MYK23466.1 HsdR family type I site-specific deoxyribonuclease [Candidatus Poribacteria bacterium]
MSERSVVQDPLLKYADEIGWQSVSSSEAMRMRGGDTAALCFFDTLKSQLLKLNRGIVDDANCAEIIRKLGLLNATLTGNRDALSWLRGEQSIFVASENRNRNVTLIDFETPDNNLFHVTDEWEQQNAAQRNRADIVFLINGIPVAVVETKNAGKPDGLALGVEQIRRYHSETPEMFTTAQLFGVTQLLDFFYGVTWNTSRKNLFNWKIDEAPLIRGVGGLNYEQKVKTFFDRDRFLKVLQQSIIFQSRDDQLTKIVLRQHQTRAVEKVIERVHDPNKRRGLVWHTQGSGKTLTMISIAARLLRSGEQTEKPTVLMVVDRNELESQLFRNITGYGITTLEVAQSKDDLEEILSSDYRGLVVSMIHKFDKRPANLNTREGVVVLIDEAHRTTGGNFGNYLMSALPNATYIGFTGTPIDSLSKGEGTFKVFGVDDKQGYLDKYAISESIKDCTTVRLSYALAPSTLWADREILDREFLNLADAEGVSDPDELNAILDRAVNLKAMMKAPDRVEKIAQFVAEHFQETVEPMGFKAFLVGVDREACALYKQALDKYLPPEYSEVVYSTDNRDSELMKTYHRTPEQEKDVRKRFINKNEHPRILIVTQKLLTGFDAPILYCMYLDKPMRDHLLLQAIARVNRPYEDTDGLVKPAGFVLDFVGIFEHLEKALAFDSDEVESVIQNIDVLKETFAKLMRETAQQYLPLAEGSDDKAKEQAIVYFTDKEVREAFFTFFKQVQNFYNILSPDVFLRPFIEDYQALATLYGLIRTVYFDRTYVDKELTTKTQRLLQAHTEGDLFELPHAVYELNETTLQEIDQSDASDTVKVLNLVKILRQKVTDEGESSPYLIPLGERVETVAEDYENRQSGTQDALAKFMRLAEEVSRATREQNQMDMDNNTYAVYTVLRNAIEDVNPEQARAVDQVFAQFPDYRWDDHQQSQLRGTLYQTLEPSVDIKTKIEITNKLLRLERL